MGSASSMDKLLMNVRGLSVVTAEAHHVEDILKHLSSENVREFETLYQMSPHEALMSAIETDICFAVVKDGVTLSITGLYDCGSYAVMWAVFSKHMRKHRVSFLRGSKRLIDFYHTLNCNIECRVWIENEMIHQWLSFLGFEPQVIVETGNNQELVNFVRCVQPEFQIDNSASRPVMH